MDKEYTIRNASIEDIDEVCEIEKRCFPAAEAADRDTFKMRLESFPECFWLLSIKNKTVSFINGMSTNSSELTDEMYAGTSLYDRDGRWLMIFGVDTLPEYRGRKLASTVMERVIEDSRAMGRRGIVLTCKEEKIGFYSRFGFINEGVSVSEHGGAVWYQMRLIFTNNIFAAISRQAEASTKRWHTPEPVSITGTRALETTF